MKTIFQIIFCLVLIGGAIFLLTQFNQLFGNAMAPSFPDGQRYVSIKAIYWFSQPKRRDVVIYNRAGSEGNFIGRVIGLPGEKVSIRDGQVFINNQPLSEPYLSPGTTTTSEISDFSATNSNNYFIMGDNRSQSNDSRVFGFVDGRDITSKVVLKF